jgi:hypothetical protein
LFHANAGLESTAEAMWHYVLLWPPAILLYRLISSWLSREVRSIDVRIHFTDNAGSDPQEYVEEEYVEEEYW